MWNVIGNEKITENLLKSIPNGLAQSYLFSGSSHLGKFLVAKNFAKSIQCQEKEIGFCGCCKNCKSVEDKNHPDVYIIEPIGDKKKEINIKTIRELRYNLNLSPYQSKYKIAIIKNAHKMNHEAQNALLKTLEEPSPYVIIILTTKTAKELLPTIVSRCMQYNFTCVKKDDIRKSDIFSQLDKKEIERIILLSQGRPGFAVNLVKNRESIKEIDKIIDNLEENILVKGIVERFKFVEKFCGNNKDQILEELNIWINYLRDIILIKLGLDNLIINIGKLENLKKLEKKYSINHLHFAISKIKEISVSLLKTNVNARLALEVLILNI